MILMNNLDLCWVLYRKMYYFKYFDQRVNEKNSFDIPMINLRDLNAFKCNK